MGVLWNDLSSITGCVVERSFIHYWMPSGSFFHLLLDVYWNALSSIIGCVVERSFIHYWMCYVTLTVARYLLYVL